MDYSHKRGFTLIELLLVLGIIGILMSVVLASIAPAREKARDARRFQDMTAIQTALELYYARNGSYPALFARTSAANCGVNWCTLETTLAPFIDKLPRDPSGLQGTYIYYYDSNAGDGNQSYGLMMRPESAMNLSKAESDGGFYSTFYEVGPQPVYCMSKYANDPTPVSRRWWPGVALATVCQNGN